MPEWVQSWEVELDGGRERRLRDLEAYPELRADHLTALRPGASLSRDEFDGDRVIAGQAAPRAGRRDPA